MAPLLTAAEVAEILRVKREFVYANKHLIGFQRLGRLVRFRRESVEAFVEQHTKSVPQRIGDLSVRSL